MVSGAMALFRRMVVGASEAQRVTGRQAAWDREEWDIALLCDGKSAAKEKQDSVALYRIYRDLATGLLVC